MVGKFEIFMEICKRNYCTLNLIHYFCLLILTFMYFKHFLEHPLNQNNYILDKENPCIFLKASFGERIKGIKEIRISPLLCYPDFLKLLYVFKNKSGNMVSGMLTLNSSNNINICHTLNSELSDSFKNTSINYCEGFFRSYGNLDNTPYTIFLTIDW